MTNPDFFTGPHFSSEAQEVFVEGERIFEPKTGREGTYLGLAVEYNQAVVLWDAGWGRKVRTRAAADFSDIRNLYR